PAPAEADLPRLYCEVEARRLRNLLSPQEPKEEEDEWKGIKGLPKHPAIGAIVTTKRRLVEQVERISLGGVTGR
ncbi:hypothetical protein BT96DRAFT_1062056, partial [Gymnopus androsaceus JB14]